MACDPEELENVPLFSLLDPDEKAILAAQVELRRFAARERIYKIGDPGGKAYVVVSGGVRLTMVDEDHQEVVVDQALATASSSVLRPCSTRRPTRPTRTPWANPSAWKWHGATLKF